MTQDHQRPPPGSVDPDATIPVHRPSAPPGVDEGYGPRGTYRLPAPTASNPGLEMPESWDMKNSVQRLPTAQLPFPEARAHRRQLRPVLAVLGVVAVGSLSAAVAWKLTDGPASVPQEVPTAEAAAPSASHPPPASSGSAAVAASAAVPVATSSAGAASASPSSPAPSASTAEAPVLTTPEARSSCFASLMPSDAFGQGEPPSLEAACTGSKAYATTLVLKSRVVAAGGAGVTQAMSEWSMLGWYEIAAFAAMRAHCCPDAKALSVRDQFASCQLEEALAYVTNAIDDDRAMSEALDHYDKAVRCLTRRGWAPAFGRGGPPYGGERKFFDRVMKRIHEGGGR
ncbi:MAG: hypothetical protein R3B72_15310 [Polyangiaceae bacterium]